MSNIATVTVHNWAGITDDDGQVSITTKFTLEVGAPTTTSFPVMVSETVIGHC